MKKPRNRNVLVTFQDHKTWYPAKLNNLLSTQFSAEFVDAHKKPQYGYYFYKDRNITWKDAKD
jgi:hypothetical protein